jgi:hypothetical protein
MPNFLANYKTKTKRPVSFQKSDGTKVKFKARRQSHRRKRVSF